MEVDVVEDVKIVVGLHVALVLSLRRTRRHGPAEGNRLAHAEARVRSCAVGRVRA